MLQALQSPVFYYLPNKLSKRWPKSSQPFSLIFGFTLVTLIVSRHRQALERQTRVHSPSKSENLIYSNTLDLQNQSISLLKEEQDCWLHIFIIGNSNSHLSLGVANEILENEPKSCLTVA